MKDTKSSWPDPGPLETHSFPEQLSARVVTPGAQPRIHGYDVESDLAQHYNMLEVAYLALTGELPEPEVTRALNATLVFFSPLSVACAPAHAAVLARLCGAPPSSILSVSAIGLAEQVRALLDDHQAILHLLAQPDTELPETCRSEDPDEWLAVDQLARLLDGFGVRVPALYQHPTRQVAVLAALSSCGLVSRHQLETILVWARLPIVMAEAAAERPGNFKSYPINIPHYVYKEAES
jgi:hypothetical protein